MKHLILSVICILFSLVTLPRFIPQLSNHVFFLGELDIKWMHVLAFGLLMLVFKGGK